jgi:hypothetical protein
MTKILPDTDIGTDMDDAVCLHAGRKDIPIFPRPTSP